MDSSDIRDALAAGLTDTEAEIRGEALVGLARRRDSRVFSELVKKWASHDVSMLSIEAAQELADPALIPHLIKLSESLDCTEDQSFADSIVDAITACKKNMQPNS